MVLLLKFEFISSAIYKTLPHYLFNHSFIIFVTDLRCIFAFVQRRFTIAALPDRY